MKALLIVAGLFFSLFAGVIAWFAADPRHEYDLNLVIPIDTRHMPRAVVLPKVEAAPNSAADDTPAADGHAEAGTATVLPDRPPVQLGYSTGAASEGR